MAVRAGNCVLLPGCLQDCKNESGKHLHPDFAFLFVCQDCWVQQPVYTFTVCRSNLQAVYNIAETSQAKRSSLSLPLHNTAKQKGHIPSLHLCQEWFDLHDSQTLLLIMSWTSSVLHYRNVPGKRKHLKFAFLPGVLWQSCVQPCRKQHSCLPLQK